MSSTAYLGGLLLYTVVGALDLWSALTDFQRKKYFMGSLCTMHLVTIVCFIVKLVFIYS